MIICAVVREGVLPEETVGLIFLFLPQKDIDARRGDVDPFDPAVFLLEIGEVMGRNRPYIVGKLDQATTGRENLLKLFFDGITDGYRQRLERQAGDDRTDMPLPGAEMAVEIVRQLGSISVDDEDFRKAVLEKLSHLSGFLHHDQPFRVDPLAQNCCGDGAGTSPEFDDIAFLCARNERGHAVGQTVRARTGCANVTRIGNQLAEKKAECAFSGLAIVKMNEIT